MSRRTWRKGVYQSTTHLAVVLLLVIVFVSVAYFFAIPDSRIPAQQAEILDDLQTNREIWLNRRPLSYRYIIRRTCFCLEEYVEPYIATEERGHKTASYRSHIQTRSGEILATPPDAIWLDNLFDVVEQAVSEGDKVTVNYDSRYGYPALVNVNRGHKATDADDRYEVRDFEVLEYQ